MEYALNEQNFTKEVLESNVPVLVDFYADWCGPCRAMSPVVTQLAEEFEGKIKVGKVNTDQNDGLANEYGILSIPNFKLFVSGKVAEEIVGSVPKSVLLDAINKHL